MRRPIFVLALLACVSGPAGDILASPAHMCLIISASDEFEFVTRGEPWTGERTLYVWTRACIVTSQGSDFDLVGSLEVVDVVPRDGVVNTGSATSPVLEYPECSPSMVVAEIVVRDESGAGGTLCFARPNDPDGPCATPCRGPGGYCLPALAYGFSTTGVVPCVDSVSSETITWSAVKATFR